MQVLENGEAFKLVSLQGTKLLFIALPILTYKDSNKNIRTLDLSGIGNTGKDTHAQPWLVTATCSRASYIILSGEHVATSYIQEKLHLYDKDLALEAARAIYKLIGNGHV